MFVEINGFNRSNNKWSMIIDIDVICESMGKKQRDKYDGSTYTLLTIPRTKKIFKLIKRYVEDNILNDISIYLEKYPHVLEVWNKVK